MRYTRLGGRKCVTKTKWRGLSVVKTNASIIDMLLPPPHYLWSPFLRMLFFKRIGLSHEFLADSLLETMATRWVSRSINFLVIIIIVLLSLTSQIKAKGTKYVTYSSVLKLMNVQNNVRLHSHDIKYGSGSGQQSVTGTETKEDNNSHWIVKGATGTLATRGKPIKCGDTIRLEHSATKKNLHSHKVPSPLSGQQEVSAYGDSKGEGDTGDHWMVICHGDYWERNEPVELRHIDTSVYLSVSGRTYGSPISGQVEIVGSYSSDGNQAQWKAMEGVFIHPNNFKSSFHDEL